MTLDPALKQEATTIVYLHGSPEKPPVASHWLIVSPAGERPREFPLGKDGENGDWWDQTGDRPTPRQFTYEFRRGMCEVPNNIGKYLVMTGQVQTSRLILPNLWDH